VILVVRSLLSQCQGPLGFLCIYLHNMAWSLPPASRVPAAHQCPWGLFVQQGLPGTVSPFSRGTHRAGAQTGWATGPWPWGTWQTQLSPTHAKGSPVTPWDTTQLDICPKQWQYHIYWAIEHEPPEAPPMLRWSHFAHIASTYLYKANNLLFFGCRISGKRIMSGIREIHTI